MKKIIILSFILTLFAAASFAQKEGEIKKIDKGIYQVEFSEFFRSPITVTYKIYKTHSEVKRGSLGFKAEPGLLTTVSKDYEANEYDKGHMAPAETFSDTQEHIEATFTYANCALQNFQLNRGLWKVLEMKERQMSQTDSIKVINTVLFTKPYKKLASGSYVPSGFRKEIISLSTGKKMIYEFPNSETTHSIYDYQIQNDFEDTPNKGKKSKEIFRPNFQHD